MAYTDPLMVAAAMFMAIAVALVWFQVRPFVHHPRL